jgi:hypothetical protein
MDTDQFSPDEIARRVKAAVKGAFSGPSKPLKDIPRKNGESRIIEKKRNARRKSRR